MTKHHTLGTIIAAAAIALAGLTVGHRAAGADDPGAMYVNAGPARVLDTRGGPRVKAGNAPAVDTGILGATAVAVNITVIDPGGGGFVTAWPTGPAPNTSVLNVDEAGQTDTNFVIVPVVGGVFRLMPSMDAHLVVDLMGYFVNGAPEPIGP